MATTTEKMGAAAKKRSDKKKGKPSPKPKESPTAEKNYEQFRPRIEMLADDAKTEMIMDLISAYSTPAEVETKLADLEAVEEQLPPPVMPGPEESIAGMPPMAPPGVPPIL